MPSKPIISQSQFLSFPFSIPHHDDDDDDFQIPVTQTLRIIPSTSKTKQQQPLKPSNNNGTHHHHRHRHRPSKKPKRPSNPGKENLGPTRSDWDPSNLDESCSLDLIKSSLDHCISNVDCNERLEEESDEKRRSKMNGGYLCNSIESRLIKNRVDCGSGASEECTELDVLLKLCGEEDHLNAVSFEVECPLCGEDISDLSEELRQVHTNHCLDKGENQAQQVVLPSERTERQFLPQTVDASARSPRKVVDVSPVLKWIRGLGLEKYEEAFVREEIDWDSLQWLTEEDLFSIGVTTLGPRKKIVHALSELRKGRTLAVETHLDAHVGNELGSRNSHGAEIHTVASTIKADATSKLAANKLITDYFPCSVADMKKICSTSRGQHVLAKRQSGSGQKRVTVKNHAKTGKLKDIPLWCRIPGTPFRVDAFKYLRGDCSHWFLTHFHMDHYQGLTRSFCHGKIYCSLITAKLVNMKIGIPWDRIEVLPLNQKISVSGIDVTCLDANHCPGSIIILFEPPNGKAVLHTGDFRFSEEMTSMAVLQLRPIHTLILDTTYCNPQYDFPKQEAVIQFVIEAIQAEAFNPKTLFLIGSYTIGKERLFLEVARVLRRKVYVTAAKLRLIECLGFSEEDMQWFTLNEQESHIHVVPMWTLASFKRLKHISNLYVGRFSLIVAFSPTGWTFGKGKKKSPGRRWQQGTIIRYEVPYSEHSSFTELREFVQHVSPESIIPSVNNDGPDSANAMVSLLLS